MRVRPVHPLEDNLPLVGPVEDHGHAVLEMPRFGEHDLRRVSGQQVPDLGLAGLPFHDRAVVDDERQRNRQQIGDRLGEMKGASGDERDVDAGGDRVDQRVTVGIGKPSATVKERAVDVDCEQADHTES